MANRIRGITVEIGGDTTKLEASLKSVNSTIRTTQTELWDVNKLLKLDPSNTELLSQKQRALKDAIGATKEKLDALKTPLAQYKAMCSYLKWTSIGEICIPDMTEKGSMKTADKLGKVYELGRSTNYDL